MTFTVITCMCITVAKVVAGNTVAVTMQLQPCYNLGNSGDH